MVEYTFPNKSGNSGHLKKIIIAVGKLGLWARIYWGRSTRCFVYGFVFQVIREKNCVAKILHRIWETFLIEDNRNYNSCKFSYKFAFIPFLSFQRNQKQESNFHQNDDLVTRSISVFWW